MEDKEILVVVIIYFSCVLLGVLTGLWITRDRCNNQNL